MYIPCNAILPNIYKCLTNSHLRHNPTEISALPPDNPFEVSFALHFLTHFCSLLGPRSVFRHSSPTPPSSDHRAMA